MEKIKIVNALFLAGLLVTILNTTQCASTEDSDDSSAGDKTYDNITVDASGGTDGDEWAYVNFRTGEIVTVTDASSDTNWDIGFIGAKIRTNSGTSGPGTGGTYDPGATEISGIGDVSSATFVEDDEYTLYTTEVVSVNALMYGTAYLTDYSGTAYDGWYDYDSTTHLVSPKDKAFVLRNADGSTVKIKILGYSSYTYSIDYENIEE